LTAPADYARQLAETKARSSPTSPSAALWCALQVEAAAMPHLGGVAVIKPELLDEVTALVEWPVAQAGNFERRFLDVPAEALISTMQDQPALFSGGGRAWPAAAALYHHDQPGKPRSGAGTGG
jgi:glycyl-tRNA synthetase beta chain